MFGWIAGMVSGFFSGLMFYIVLAAFGGVLGLAIAFTGRRSLLAAAGLCASVLVAAQLFGALDRFSDARAQARIAALEQANKLKETKIAEIRETNAALEAFLEDEREAAATNAEVVGRLKAAIAAQDDKPECTLSEDFLDELENLE